MVNERKLMNLKNRLEGHNAAYESTGIHKTTADSLVKNARAARETWAQTTGQSWVKREKK
jgi:hypothetical protein